jgi:phosphate transport system substrate-binding protein
MQGAAKRVMKAWPKIRITWAGGGSGVGVQMVGEGLVDIGNAGRPIKPGENEKYALTSFPFAVDGVAVVVHPANPLRELTSDQARAVFAGTITNWKDLGGADREIHLYGRDEASGTREVFWKKLLAKGEVAKSTNVIGSNGAMKTAVSADEDGIGYLSIGHVDGAVAAIAIDGVEASQENAKTGAYPVVRMLYMNTKEDRTELVQAFLDYVMSGEVAEIVSGAGYIPLAGE